MRRTIVEYETIPPSLWASTRRQRIGDLVPGTTRRDFALGRSALRWLCTALGWGPGDRVMIPAFICESVVAPFAEAGVTIDFYAVGENLETDLSDLSERARGSVGGLVVHYFGWPQPRPVQDWLASPSRDGFWIEDISHAVLSARSHGNVGSGGDVALASFRKVIPCPDGASLGFRDAPPADTPVPQLGRYRQQAWIRGLRMGVTGATGTGRGERSRFVRGIDARLRRLRVRPPVQVGSGSSISRHVIERHDLATASARRRSNAHHLMERMRNVHGVTPLHNEIDEGVVPYVLPVRVADGRRDPLRRALKDEGVDAAHHWKHPLPLTRGSFPVSDALVDELLSLPIDERYQAEDMTALADLIARFMHRLTSPQD